MQHPTAADLIFSDQANHNFSKTLGELKRSALSIHNRLKSIQADASFAEKVAAAYSRPLVANERCGSWYINPQTKAGSAYFKSTDGHTGVWKFSSRRLNLHLLDIIGKNDGCIIVDSTRRGKRMPDALSKTIPIWCSVINRFVFPESPEFHDLYTPPQIISDTEHTQIKQLLPTFLDSLKALAIPIHQLENQISKPLRPIWITPESRISETGTIFDEFHPVICCTVSRRVLGGEVSEGGYIQGAGDDTENWAHGLTPPVFWANDTLLLSSAEGDLPELIERLVIEHVGVEQTGLRHIQPTTFVLIGTYAANDSQCKIPSISLLPAATDEQSWLETSTSLELGLGPHKLGSRNLRSALPRIISFAEKVLLHAPDVSSEAPQRIIIKCDSGRDLSIGVALAIICIFCNDDGSLRKSVVQFSSIDKTFIRRRLGWISTSMPDANPSRATLQSVNSFLMERR
ncbi:tRNA a64-2'-o-ribosylphosphate transferase-like protein [Bisporella sp. PMI_857]|nr:tRNA a64-2'-o-ribosylphosphate transferase-like protein [Bisporella sp. PMI_857]